MELISKFDNYVFSLMEAISCVFLDWVFKIITYTGNKGIIWIVIGLVLVMKKKTRKVGLCVILSLLATVIINNLIIKEIFDRTRPFIADPTIKLIVKAPQDASFPSGHTASSFTAATAIFLFNRRKGVYAYLYATLMGLSRIYLHVHYATDVIVGMIVGIVIAKLVAVGLDKMYDKLYRMINGET